MNSKHFGLTLFCRPPPRPIKEIERFSTHICVTREMRAVFHDAYMRHQAKMPSYLYRNPIVEIRRSDDRLISTMGFPILARWHLYIEAGPWLKTKCPQTKRISTTRISYGLCCSYKSHINVWVHCFWTQWHLTPKLKLRRIGLEMSTIRIIKDKSHLYCIHTKCRN